MRAVQVITTGLVWGALIVGLPACSAGASGSARSANDKGNASETGSAVEELDAVVSQLEAAADEVVAPLDQAEEVLKRLETLLASGGEGARGEVIRIVVSVVNTGDVVISADTAPQEEAVTGAKPSADAAVDQEALGGEKVVLTEEPPELQEGGAVALDPETSTDAASDDVLSKRIADTDALDRAKDIGRELRALLSSLAATPSRAKQLGVVAKDILMAVPKLGAQAVASAQLKANNPLAGAAVRAEGQADIARVQEIVQRAQSRVSEIQEQVLSLPSRAAKFGSRAQQILAGAVLTPPPPDGVDATAVVNLKVPTAEEPGERVGATAAPQRRPYQWGWLAVSGASGVAAAVGGVVLINAHQQLMVCHEPSSHGCANYTQLHHERTAGWIFLSTGAAVTTTTFIGGFVANKTRNPREDLGAGLSCGAGLGAVQCAGAF